MKKLYVFRRLLQYAAPHRVNLMLVAALSLVGVAFEVLKPFPVKLVIDNVLSDKKLPALLEYFLQGNIPTKEQLLIGSVVVMVVIAILGATISFITFYATVKLAQRLVYDLSVDFFSKLQRLSLTFYSRNQVGDLLQRMSEDVYVGYYLVAQLILPVGNGVRLAEGLCMFLYFFRHV